MGHRLPGSHVEFDTTSGLPSSLSAETEERFLASDVDAAFRQRRRRKEGLAEIVGGQRLRVTPGAA